MIPNLKKMNFKYCNNANHTVQNIAMSTIRFFTHDYYSSKCPLFFHLTKNETDNQPIT